MKKKYFVIAALTFFVPVGSVIMSLILPTDSLLLSPSPANAQQANIRNGFVSLTLPNTGNQDDNWSCGPNSAARVLAFYGHSVDYISVRSVSQEEHGIVPPRICLRVLGLEKCVDTSDFKTGFEPWELRDVMNRWEGGNAKYEHGADLDRLKSLLSQGKPVLVLLRVGSFQPGRIFGTWPEMHWVAVHGFNDREITYTDTDGSTNNRKPYDQFLSEWDWRIGSGLASETLHNKGVRPKTMVWIDRTPRLSGNGTSNPSYIIETLGQPAVAVFESRRESFALGCPEIRDAWGVTDRRSVSGDKFQRSLRANPVVADLPCNGTIQHVALSDEGPQLLLVRHRDGNLYRHYINSIKFPNALRSGSIQRNNGPTFRATFSRRGNDFQSLTP